MSSAGGDVFDRIRAACAAVAVRARHVGIADRGPNTPERYARRLLAERGAATSIEPAWDTELHLGVGDGRGTAPDEALRFVVTLDAINFGSGWFPHLVKRPGMSGYDTVASRLRDRFVARGAPAAAELAAFAPADAAALLGQPAGDLQREAFVREVAAALAELGAHLLARWGGSFTALIDAAENRAARLVELLAALPRYRDVATYPASAPGADAPGAALEVPLYKRAQITASDLSLALSGRGRGRFDDLARLTIFADNLVPHVLRVDGVLRYAPDLAARIEAGAPIPAGSPEEVEIRAVALHAVERMVAALRADGHAVRAQQLDVLLWERGRAERYRRAPRHRTESVYY